MVGSIASGISLALPPGLDTAVCESAFCGEMVPSSEQQRQQEQERRRQRSRVPRARHGGVRVLAVDVGCSACTRLSVTLSP